MSEDSLRNASQALELAQRARNTKGGLRANVLDTWAAALAENGRFDEAARAEQNALDLVRNDAELRSRLRLHLEDYKEHRAVREPLDAGMF